MSPRQPASASKLSSRSVQMLNSTHIASMMITCPIMAPFTNTHRNKRQYPFDSDYAATTHPAALYQTNAPTKTTESLHFQLIFNFNFLLQEKY